MKDSVAIMDIGSSSIVTLIGANGVNNSFNILGRGEVSYAGFQNAEFLEPENLKFAIKLQEKAEELYPGLFKPIMLTTSRYNQHTGKYANIMEVGATGNTLEQCLTSMKYLAKVIDEIMK